MGGELGWGMLIKEGRFVTARDRTELVVCGFLQGHKNTAFVSVLSLGGHLY